MARTTAQRAAEQLARCGGRRADRRDKTQARLDEMDNDALLIGTSFSLGLGVGLFLSGANRFLILAHSSRPGDGADSSPGRDQQGATSRHRAHLAQSE